MPNVLAFLAFTCITAFTPGPNNCMALSHATRGLRGGLVFSLGVFGGMLLVMLASAFLSGLLALHLDNAAVLMQSAGCAYMLWLAWSLWKSGAMKDEALQSGGRLFVSGCLLQLVNPKLIAYGITAYSIFILPHYTDLSTLLWFALLLALVGFAGTLAWALGGAALKGVFQRRPVLVNRLLAMMLLGCAASLLA